jgi:3-phosphoshikimate 1-carboxyvinyltransferase
MLGMFAEGPSTVRGIAHLRHKESDRLELLARNLRALGRPAEARHDRLEIGSREGPLRATTIVTESDHRLAMAFAVAGLRIGGLTVDDAGCVAKSNPQFWEQFAALEGSV